MTLTREPILPGEGGNAPSPETQRELGSRVAVGGAPSPGEPADRVRASIHVIPAAGMRAEASAGRDGGSGIATVAMRTAERLGDAADLVLVAVAPGEGDRLADYLQGGQAVRWLRPPPTNGGGGR